MGEHEHRSVVRRLGPSPAAPVLLSLGGAGRTRRGALAGLLADGGRQELDERDVCLVVTQWRSEEDFRAWMQSADFAVGHSQHRTGGPVGTASEVWSFDVLETETI